MTDPRSKSEREGGELSETCKTHLIDLFVANEYDRHTDTKNKYVEKGLAVEEDSLTLYSRYKKRFFQKNQRRLKNEFINGEPDAFTGLEIEAADTIIDIKSPWDIYTFTRAKFGPLNKQYYWQMQGYMALTNATKAILAYCLINTPEPFIAKEKRFLYSDLGGDSMSESSQYETACIELERNMTYDDIPLKDRVFEIEIERNDADIQRIYKRVQECDAYYQQTFLK